MPFVAPFTSGSDLTATRINEVVAMVIERCQAQGLNNNTITINYGLTPISADTILNVSNCRIDNMRNILLFSDSGNAVLNLDVYPGGNIEGSSATIDRWTVAEMLTSLGIGGGTPRTWTNVPPTGNVDDLPPLYRNKIGPPPASLNRISAYIEQYNDIIAVCRAMTHFVIQGPMQVGNGSLTEFNSWQRKPPVDPTRITGTGVSWAAAGVDLNTKWAASSWGAYSTIPPQLWLYNYDDGNKNFEAYAIRSKLRIASMLAGVAQIYLIAETWGAQPLPPTNNPPVACDGLWHAYESSKVLPIDYTTGYINDFISLAWTGLHGLSEGWRVTQDPVMILQPTFVYT